MKKELLSPAGDFETLKQAIHNGCDAIYLGGKKFGARKFASNFDDDEMIEAIRYCHLYGVKIYVTVNTMIFDEEVDEYLQYITFLHENGVDAVIMQDIGMISLVRKVLPNLDIHVSTQAHTHNINQIKMLEKLGVTRVVVARELSLDEINSLDTNLEIEAFIHGALCICYSGQCLFSSMLLNRSGNRGECAGICRLPFSLLEDSKKVTTSGNYLLSPKELNTTNHIKELLDSKITSFKIEGRMKSPTTIGFITRLYRNLIDNYEKNGEAFLTREEQEQLLVLFNRGFTEGYLFNKSGKDFMNILSPNHIGIEIGQVVDVNKNRIKIRLSKPLHQGDGIRFQIEQTGMIINYMYDTNNKLISQAKSSDIIEIDNKLNIKSGGMVLKTIDSVLLKQLESYQEKKIPIFIKALVNLGKSFILTITDGVNSVTVEDDIVEVAIKQGTDKNRILEQLSKLGNTPFICKNCEIDMDQNIFIPISKLNELRRIAVTKLINIRKSIKREVIKNEIQSPLKLDDIGKIELIALVRNKEQLTSCLLEKVDRIYVTDLSLYQEYKYLGNIYLRLERVINNYPTLENENLLVGELGSIYKYHNSNIVTDYYLNISNRYSIDYLRKLGVDGITLSIENNINTIKSLVDSVGSFNMEVIVYGRIEAMIMKYCPLKMLVNNDKSPCNICRNEKKYELVDRNNAKYRLIQNKELTHLFYHTNLELKNDLLELYFIGIKRYRFEFFDENGNQVKNILKKYQSILSQKQ